MLVGPIDVLRVAFAVRVAELASLAMARRNRFAMAVPGGSVASALLPALADAPVDWSRTDIFWCDERAVPIDAAESNYGTACAGWLAAPRLARARLHRMVGEADDLELAASAYADDLRATLGSSPILDLVVLGVGEDGHVASLFPGADLLHETVRLVGVVLDAPKPPGRRITLTLPAILEARVVCVAALGDAKREVMTHAAFDPSSDLPVARVIRGAPDTWVFLESTA